jgi:hypothetical protein
LSCWFGASSFSLFVINEFVGSVLGDALIASVGAEEDRIVGKELPSTKGGVEWMVGLVEG